ncbi:MAG: hypothetical protein ABIH57_00860 [Candidatus Omnitrophota bacterium]
MEKRKKGHAKEFTSDSLFSFYEDCLKKIISQDLNAIYGNKAHLVNQNDPWIFQIDK